VLGVALFQTAREYSFAQAMAFSFGGGAGFTLALVLMASVRERLQLSSVPGVAQGTALSLMLAGCCRWPSWALRGWAADDDLSCSHGLHASASLAHGILVDRIYRRFAARNPQLGPFRDPGKCGCCSAGSGCDTACDAPPANPTRTC
jgi:hypothetical protein